MAHPVPPDPETGPTPPRKDDDAGSPGHVPRPIDLAEESVAGEEDPGAAFDDGLPPLGG